MLRLNQASLLDGSPIDLIIGPITPKTQKGAHVINWKFQQTTPPDSWKDLAPGGIFLFRIAVIIISIIRVPQSFIQILSGTMSMDNSWKQKEWLKKKNEVIQWCSDHVNGKEKRKEGLRDNWNKPNFGLALHFI